MRSDNDRAILRAYHEGGYRLREIAAALDVHYSTVSRRLAAQEQAAARGGLLRCKTCGARPDPRCGNVAAYGVFRGTHTGERGPVPPTGKKVEADYVYVMDFDGDRIRHLTKIWNDGISLTQLGWA